MGTNIGGREFTDYRQENPSQSNDGRILRELYLHMTSPEEEQRKKAEAAAKPAEKPAPDAIGFLGQLVGDARNLAMDAVTGNHSGDRVLSSITPQLAAEYQRGKQLQERIDSGAVKRTQLKPDEQRSLDSYEKVKGTIAQVPIYDRDSLTRYVEKGIEQKARTSPHEQPKPTTTAAREIAAKPQEKTVQPSVNRESSDPKKLSGTAVPQTRRDAQSQAAPEVKPPTPKPAHPLQSAQSVQPEKSGRSAEIQTPAAKQTPAKFEQPGGKTEQIFSAGANKDVRAESQKPVRSDGQPDSSIEQAKKRPVAETRDVNSTSTAASTFERRTAYDARSQNESKQIAAQNSEPKLQTRQVSQSETQDTKSKNSSDARAHESNAVTGSEKNLDPGSFENMRRLLEERSSIANKTTQKQDSETFAVADSVRRMPNYIGQSMGSADDHRRFGLADAKAAMTPSRLQEILQISQTEFPEGLHWRPAFRPVAADRDPASNQKKQADAVAPSLNQHAKPAHPTGRFVDVGPGTKDTGRVSDMSAGKTADGPVRDAAARAGESSGLRAPEGNVIRTPGVSDSKTPEAGVSKPPDAGVGKIQDGGTAKAWQGGAIRPPEVVGGKAQIDPIKNQASANRAEATGLVRGQQTGRPPDSNFVSADKSSDTFPSQTLIFKGRVDNRYITGVEIALAAIVAAAGAKRVRLDEIVAQTAEGKLAMPQVQRIEAFLPDAQESQSPSFVETKLSTEKAIRRLGEKDKEPSSPVDVAPQDQRLPIHKFNRKTKLIGPGDTLVSIAESHTGGEGRIAWLIADLNKSRVKDSYVDGKRIVEIRSRESIELPSSEEALEFLNTLGRHLKPEDLITVVVETQIDRELLNEQFGVFVDGDARPGTAAGGAGIGSYPSALPQADASALSRTAVNSDGSLVFPPLTLQSSSVLSIARVKLASLTRKVFDGSNLRFSRLKNALKRENIKRNL